MALPGIEASILIDQFEFGGSTSGIETTISVTEGDYTNLASSGQESEPILPKMLLSMSGYFDGVGAGKLEEELKARLATAGVVVTALYGKSQTYAPCYMLDRAYGQQIQIATPVAGLATVQGNWTEGSKGYRGWKVLRATISTTGVQTGVDFVTAGTNGGMAVLHVKAITGTATNATLVVQSAAQSNYSDAVTEGTFTFSAVGGYRVPLSGAIGRYIRVNVTSMGGATNFAVVAAVAVDGVTY